MTHLPVRLGMRDFKKLGDPSTGLNDFEIECWGGGG